MGSEMCIRDRPTRGAQVGGPTWGPSGWAHVGPKWVGPRRAQVGGPTRGPSGPKLGPSQNFGTQKNPKNKNSQNQNPFCPKCRQGFFKPEKEPPGPIWGPPGTKKVQSKSQISKNGKFMRNLCQAWAELRSLRISLDMDVCKSER